MRSLLLALLGLTACESYPSEPVETPWDAQNPVAAADGLYVRLLNNGGLVHISPDGARRVDIGAGEVVRVDLAPDNTTATAFVRRTRCQPDDPSDARGARFVEDCPVDARELSGELLMIDDAQVRTAVPISAHYNAITFAADARWAIVWLDGSQSVDLEGTGVVDLTSVQVVDLESGVATPVSVGFAASRVLFTDDASRAVVLSQDSVALVELGGERPERSTVFPLTLESGQRFDPVGVGLTPEGRHALVAAQGRDDLYALRLSPPSINLVNLSGRPSAMAIVPPTIADGDRLNDPLARNDRTVLTHSNVAAVNLVEHDSFEVTTLPLLQPVDQITLRERQAMLWRFAASRDVYALDVDEADTTRFRLQNLPTSMHITPGLDFAVALTRPYNAGGTGSVGNLYSSSPGMEVLDLRDDRGRTTPFLLESSAVGLAFSESEDRLDALLLQNDVDYLLQLDLFTLQQQELRLSAAPRAIGSLPTTDGGSEGFWITHRSALGHVSFLDPTSGEITEVRGFAAYDLFNGVPLDTSEEE